VSSVLPGGRSLHGQPHLAAVYELPAMGTVRTPINGQVRRRQVHQGPARGAGRVPNRALTWLRRSTAERRPAREPAVGALFGSTATVSGSRTRHRGGRATKGPQNRPGEPAAAHGRRHPTTSDLGRQPATGGGWVTDTRNGSSAAGRGAGRRWLALHRRREAVTALTAAVPPPSQRRQSGRARRGQVWLSTRGFTGLGWRDRVATVEAGRARSRFEFWTRRPQQSRTIPLPGTVDQRRGRPSMIPRTGGGRFMQVLVEAVAFSSRALQPRCRCLERRPCRRKNASSGPGRPTRDVAGRGSLAVLGHKISSGPFPGAGSTHCSYMSSAVGAAPTHFRQNLL